MPTNDTKERKGYRGEAYIYEDDFGAFTKGCRTKEDAQKAIYAAVLEQVKDERLEQYFKSVDDIVIDINKIKENVMYPDHKKCGENYWTVGENICNECGETTQSKGHRTFTYEF